MKQFHIKNSFALKQVRDEIDDRVKTPSKDNIFKPFVVAFMTPDEFKSNSQNSSFWALIDCFWKSSKSSFHSYSEMIEYYYRIAGLITIKTKTSLEKSTKLKLFKVIEANSFHDWEKKAIYKLLRGEYEKHLSWSRVKKEKATLTISTLINDMFKATVNGKKFEEIIAGMERDKIFINELEVGNGRLHRIDI